MFAYVLNPNWDCKHSTAFSTGSGLAQSRGWEWTSRRSRVQIATMFEGQPGIYFRDFGWRSERTVTYCNLKCTSLRPPPNVTSLPDPGTPDAFKIQGPNISPRTHDDQIHYAGRRMQSGSIDAASMTSSTSLLRAEGALVAQSSICRRNRLT